MSDPLLLAATLGSAYLGFGLLALSQARHRRKLDHRYAPTPRQALVLRSLGGGALLASLGASLLRDGPGFGALLWATGLSGAALAVSFTLTWRPRWLWPLAPWPGARLDPVPPAQGRRADGLAATTKPTDQA